jgi:hypothetical protein
MVYDNINDSIVYTKIFEVVDGDTFDDPCTVVNTRGLWYVSMPITFYNADKKRTRFPAFVCDWAQTNCLESNFTTFTE